MSMTIDAADGAAAAVAVDARRRQHAYMFRGLVLLHTASLHTCRSRELRDASSSHQDCAWFAKLQWYGVLRAIEGQFQVAVLVHRLSYGPSAALSRVAVVFLHHVIFGASSNLLLRSISNTCQDFNALKALFLIGHQLEKSHTFTFLSITEETFYTSIL
jgi:hypothetical protein